METTGSGVLDVRGVAADDFLRVERHALDPIPEADRHGRPGGLFLLWAAAQANFSSLVTGAILITLGLGVWDAISAAVVGSVLAGVVLGLLSIVGPRTGMTQVVASRRTFGTIGAFGGAALTLFLAIGWFAVDSVFATQALMELAKKAGATESDGLKAVLLIVVVALSIVVAVYGHQTVSVFARYGALVFLAFCALLFLLLAPDMTLDHPATVHGGARVGAWALGAATFFALVASWFGFASDYSRYLPAAANGRRVALFAGGGIAIATAVVGALGILVFTIDPNDKDPIFSAVNLAAPGWLATLFFVFVALGMIWGNYFDVYTAGLAALAMRLPLSRWTAALVCGAAGGLLSAYALFGSDSFLTTYADFLGFTYIWAPAWAAVILADVFLVHPRHYAPRGVASVVAAAFQPRALIAWIAGTVAAIPFVHVNLWTGPVPDRLFGGADLSGVVGFVVGGALYFAIAPRTIEHEAPPMQRRQAARG